MSKDNENGKSMESWIWDVACSIRGAQDAPKYKDFVLPLILAKRLCDVFDDELNRIAEKVGSRDKAFKLVTRDQKLAKQLKTRNIPDGDGDKVETELKPIMENLMEKTWIRNSEGCHFRTVPSEVPNQEVKEYGENVVKLSQLIVCANCQAFPTRRPSGSYWECSCGNTELYPLVEPGSQLGIIHDEK